MSILKALIDALAALFGSCQIVGGHTKRQAYGPRWSKRRRRKIDDYTRRRPRRAW
jgi:hypothetical protein